MRSTESTDTYLKLILDKYTRHACNQNFFLLKFVRGRTWRRATVTTVTVGPLPIGTLNQLSNSQGCFALICMNHESNPVNGVSHIYNAVIVERDSSVICVERDSSSLAALTNTSLFSLTCHAPSSFW